MTKALMLIKNTLQHMIAQLRLENYYNRLDVLFVYRSNMMCVVLPIFTSCT